MSKVDPRFLLIGNYFFVSDIIRPVFYLVCPLLSTGLKDSFFVRSVDVPLQFPFIFWLFRPKELTVYLGFEPQRCEKLL